MYLNIPWHQYALIVYLAEQMEESAQWFGKTALQKLVYLLQTLFGVPVGYQYSLYIHGPFSKELMDDVDYLDGIGGLEVSFDQNANGYKIRPAQGADKIKAKAQDFLDNYRPQINQLLGKFGSMRARELELRSTIVFIDRYAVQTNREMTRQEFAQEVSSIKPHFSWAEIEEAITELEGQDYITRRG